MRKLEGDGGPARTILELAARYPHIKCAKYPDLLDFHFAVDGSGPLANEWMDKPHRLVYRLTGMLSDSRDARRARDAEIEALVAACRLARSYMSEAIEYETPCAKRDGANVDAALLPFQRSDDKGDAT